MNPPALRIAILAATLTLAACSSLIPPSQVPAAVADQWQAPLPHEGNVVALAQWWQQQGDPLLVELINAAQSVSPSVSQALARMEAARANQAAAAAALVPEVSAQYSASRGVTQIGVPVATTQTLGLQAAWEVDLVGANKAVNNAAQAQVDGSRAQWHDARVSVAAEVANLYYDLSTCMQLLEVARADAASRAQTARLADINAKAGFTAPAQAALARASAAEANNRVVQQSSQCSLNTKAMVALTGLAEADLQPRLQAALAQPLHAKPLAVTRVPAQTIAQRPDVFSAERDVAVAAAQVGSAKAQRLPRLTLNGSIGALRYSADGTDQNLDTWSFGPLTLNLPLFDNGKRAAAVQSAEAAYATSVVSYQGKVRQAVREVEEALVNLQSTDARSADTEVSAQGYGEALEATQQRYRQGFASLVELEDARRTALAAKSTQLNLLLERNRAWVALYRALGGGWDANTP